MKLSTNESRASTLLDQWEWTRLLDKKDKCLHVARRTPRGYLAFNWIASSCSSDYGLRTESTGNISPLSCYCWDWDSSGESVLNLSRLTTLRNIKWPGLCVCFKKTSNKHHICSRHLPPPDTHTFSIISPVVPPWSLDHTELKTLPKVICVFEKLSYNFGTSS